MKNVCFVNGSPKGKEAISLHFLEVLNNLIDGNEDCKYFIDVKTSTKGNNLEGDFEKMAKADAIIISFPLYVYCLPGVLMRFLEQYYLFLKNKSEFNKEVKVYAIVNCGFPEPEINNEAIRVIQNFCNRLNLNWRFGISIGCGPFVAATKDVPIMNKSSRNINMALLKMTKDIENNVDSKKENILIKPSFPKSLLLRMGGSVWIKIAKKNGLNKFDLYKRPYVS
ncbi:NAD(P)H-dependent oxidoreductase [Clostridium pasteurianum]|uniref:NADPH-dependent FMN reductase n=1 Tax=Clostridium pasteurianum BC1 TaxID=86416 RepID=R4JYE3_CLOPA|nr:NAD(P)H-dependent oxidoreductase [Clostridium pasteurianum]AGK95313.1 NADPH-dependent FMN reductase [Clostridium pasteurianum BC1]